MKWRVRMHAVIDDTLEVEGEDLTTEEQAVEAAERDWSFTEASSWWSEAEQIGGDE